MAHELVLTLVLLICFVGVQNAHLERQVLCALTQEADDTSERVKLGLRVEFISLSWICLGINLGGETSVDVCDEIIMMINAV